MDGAEPEEAAAVRRGARGDRLLHVEQQRFSRRDPPLAEERSDTRQPDRRGHEERNELNDSKEVVHAAEHVSL